jgi:hypothetical protein
LSNRPPPSLGRPVPAPPHRNGHAESDEFVIGRTSTTPRVIDPITAQPAAVPRPRAKAGRYPDLTGAQNGGALPRIYPGHRYLQYWYLPAASALAVLIAVAVIWVGDRLLGGDGDKAEAAVEQSPTPAASETTTVQAASTTPGLPTRTPSDAAPSSTSIAAPGEIAAGAEVVVVGTGDCLNIRTGSGLSNDVIACLPDGTEMTVLGGPIEADGLVWWQVESDLGTGWGAADYLALP